MGNSYRQPAKELDPMLDVKAAAEQTAREKESIGKQH